ncbi:MAG: rubredoxin [Gammaproteobacteria bacterium]|nr:rubredoxin [Gammaproteobacteria bacterium]
MKQWQCIICGYVYNEAEGIPNEGIPPGTRFEDLPDDWSCPDCGVTKSDFELVQG